MKSGRDNILVTTEKLGIFVAMKILRILILLALLGSSIFPQSGTRDYEDELKHQNKAINQLKKEIDRLHSKIRSTDKKMETAASRLTNLDEELSIINKLINELKAQEEKTRSKIEITRKDIIASEGELQNLRDRYAKRVQSTYKRGKLSSLEKIFSSATWRQAVYRQEYLDIISDIETKMAKRINTLIIDISRQKLELESTLRENLRLTREKEKQQQNIRNKKMKRKKELYKLKKDKKALAGYIDEKKAGLKQMETLIKSILEDKARFEREERIRRQQQALKTKEFNTLKARLPWPAEGRVISKFGRQWNPKLKTTTENPGIDIKGKPGSPIKPVMNGVVTTITYIRGYGTTIIIDHGSGFYSVYSHVTNIQTHVDSEVRTGDVIAYMGDSGSINGSKLHFEIWGKGQKLDPEKWLSKKK